MMPSSNPLTLNYSNANEATAPSKRTGRIILVGLIAVGLFFASMNSIWSFMERVGDAEGFSAEFITMTLSISLVFSFAGALIPALIARRIKRIIAIGIGYIMLLIAIFLLGQNPTANIYLISLCVYNFFYSFSIPFQNGWIASLDRDGRTIVLLPVMQGIGIAIGPVLAGLVIFGESYRNVIYVSIALLLCSFILFLLMKKWSGYDKNFAQYEGMIK
ncbi:MAG: hypothetical protein GKR93_17755 [Gammaproteobacteria bacterium]|nr:hypothetical protein [Gammaproteobacteria bacterium]